MNIIMNKMVFNNKISNRKNCSNYVFNDNILDNKNFNNNILDVINERTKLIFEIITKENKHKTYVKSLFLNYLNKNEQFKSDFKNEKILFLVSLHNITNLHKELTFYFENNEYLNMVVKNCNIKNKFLIENNNNYSYEFTKEDLINTYDYIEKHKLLKIAMNYIDIKSGNNILHNVVLTNDKTIIKKFSENKTLGYLLFNLNFAKLIPADLTSDNENHKIILSSMNYYSFKRLEKYYTDATTNNFNIENLNSKIIILNNKFDTLNEQHNKLLTEINDDNYKNTSLRCDSNFTKIYVSFFNLLIIGLITILCFTIYLFLISFK